MDQAESTRSEADDTVDSAAGLAASPRQPIPDRTVRHRQYPRCTD